MRFKDKKQKVHFLKGLMKGDRGLSELRQPKHPFLLAYSNHPGRYKELETGKYWSEEDIKKYEFRNPGDNVFLFFRTNDEGSKIEKVLTKVIKGGLNQ